MKDRICDYTKINAVKQKDPSYSLNAKLTKDLPTDKLKLKEASIPVSTKPVKVLVVDYLEDKGKVYESYYKAGKGIGVSGPSIKKAATATEAEFLHHRYIVRHLDDIVPIVVDVLDAIEQLKSLIDEINRSSPLNTPSAIVCNVTIMSIRERLGIYEPKLPAWRFAKMSGDECLNMKLKEIADENLEIVLEKRKDVFRLAGLPERSSDEVRQLLDNEKDIIESDKCCAYDVERDMVILADNAGQLSRLIHMDIDRIRTGLSIPHLWPYHGYIFLKGHHPKFTLTFQKCLEVLFNKRRNIRRDSFVTMVRNNTAFKAFCTKRDLRRHLGVDLKTLNTYLEGKTKVVINGMTVWVLPNRPKEGVYKLNSK